MLRPRMLLAAAGLATVLLLGCGGSDTNSTARATPAATATPAPEETAAPAVQRRRGVRLVRIGRFNAPLYVTGRVTLLAYDPARYRGALDFLSAAGGDTDAADRNSTRPVPVANAIRQRLDRVASFPDDDTMDFAEAYRTYRATTRRRAG